MAAPEDPSPAVRGIVVMLAITCGLIGLVGLVVLVAMVAER